MTVVPRGVLHRRRYFGGAIAMALALWCVSGLPSREVRARISPHPIVGPSAFPQWRTLHRWVDAVARQCFWAFIRVWPATFSAREGAERIVAALVASAAFDRMEPRAAFVAGAQLR